MSNTPLDPPKQCQEIAEASVKAFNAPFAAEGIIGTWTITLNEIYNNIPKDQHEARLNIAQRLDFWSQTLESIKT